MVIADGTLHFGGQETSRKSCVKPRNYGIWGRIGAGYFFLLDQQSGVGAVDRNQTAMLIASSVESLTGAPE